MRFNIKEFLRFEKRKMILPVFLVFLFISFIFVFASDNAYTRHLEEMNDISFKVMKALGYKASYKYFNETEKANEMNRTVERLLEDNDMLLKRIEAEAGTKEYIARVGSVILGPLGLNLCHIESIQLPYYMTCPYWNSNISYVVHDLLCVVAGYIAEADKLNFTEEGSRERFEQFMIDHPLDRTEKCEDYEKLFEPEWEVGKTKKIYLETEKTNMVIAGAFATGYVVLFFVEGYLISCIIIFIYEYFIKNKKKSKKLR